MKKLILIASALPTMANAQATIDAVNTADVLLVVGCAVLFGLGLLAGK